LHEDDDGEWPVLGVFEGDGLRYAVVGEEEIGGVEGLEEVACSARTSAGTMTKLVVVVMVCCEWRVGDRQRVKRSVQAFGIGRGCIVFNRSVRGLP